MWLLLILSLSLSLNLNLASADESTFSAEEMHARIKQFANSTENENYQLLHKWQDWILDDSISVNNLNCLFILSSRMNYTLTIPIGYALAPNGSSISLKNILMNISYDVRSAHFRSRSRLLSLKTAWETVPSVLRELVSNLKHEEAQSIKTFISEKISKFQNLVNDSFLQINEPVTKFNTTLKYLTELQLLLPKNQTDPSLELQLDELVIRWRSFTDLLKELEKHIERMRNSFILQLNWVLEQFVQTEFLLTESHLEFLARLLIAKIVEIDQTCNLLQTIGETHEFMISDSVQRGIDESENYLGLHEELIRKQKLKNIRSSLSSQIVAIVRRSMDQQDSFYKRDLNRHKNIERILTETSMEELESLINGF